MKKYLFVLVLAFAILLGNSHSAFAHVSVKPSKAGVATFQTFVVGVPVEKDMATVGIRLVIPQGFEHVTPNVKPGWRISVKRAEVEMSEGMEPTNEHAEGPVTEISWTGGVIPSGQRDEFVFSAKVPGESTILAWKAYQTYADGSVVSWDKTQEEQPKDGEGNPDFSCRKISQTSPTNPFSQVNTRI